MPTPSSVAEPPRRPSSPHGRRAPQPLRWASAHFGALAKAGSEVELATTVISSGRTMTHLEMRGTVEDREAFVVRVAAGERPPHAVQGQWVAPPDVAGGGLSIDNVLRLRDLSAVEVEDWLLLEVRPEAIEGGFGHGAARLFTDGGRLLAAGSQSMVVNNWDWRLPTER